MMKRKMMMVALLSALLVGLVGCGTAGKKDVKTVGGITLLNCSEDDLGELLQKTGTEEKVVFYNDLSLLVMALQQGRIDEAHIFGYMAEYAASRNDKFQCTYPEKAVEDSLKMAVKKENTQLQGELNTAIQDMKSDGTLEQLTKTYIEDVISGEDPKVEPMEEIKGADTIKVAVTGACAPFDYMDTAGNPAGFNVAVLSEIGKRLQKNIELVNVTADARSSALISDKVDVLFWILSVAGDDSSDLPDGIVTTDAFCTSDAGILSLK